MGVGLLSLLAKKEREESSQYDWKAREEEQEREQKRQLERELRKKRFKAFLFNGKRIMIGASNKALVGDNVTSVVEWLHSVGFTNITETPIYDIYKHDTYKEKRVEKVIIAGEEKFNEDSMIPYDAEIVVHYHMKRKIAFPYSSKQARKQNCDELATELANMGFTEIFFGEIDDLVTGWIHKDGSIQNVSVGGKEEYKKGLLVEFDTKIVIHYHTFTKKKR